MCRAQTSWSSLVLIGYRAGLVSCHATPQIGHVNGAMHSPHASPSGAPPPLPGPDAGYHRLRRFWGYHVVERDREELVATLRQELALRNREIARLAEVIATQVKTIEVTTSALPANIQTVE